MLVCLHLYIVFCYFCAVKLFIVIIYSVGANMIKKAVSKKSVLNETRKSFAVGATPEVELVASGHSALISLSASISEVTLTQRHLKKSSPKDKAASIGHKYVKQTQTPPISSGVGHPLMLIQ